jgi:hypothetical protein
MKIGLLLQREPFGKILEQTLSQYLTERYGRTYQVRWYDHIPGDISRDEQLWFCNPHLNVIFLGNAEPQTLAPTRMVFANSPFPWRRPLQWGYVQIATRRPTARWLASMAMSTTPSVPGGEHLVLWGGNSRLYLADVSGQRVCAIQKHGFGVTGMMRDLRARRQPGNWPIPRILDAAPDGTWFEQPYVAGRPLNVLPPGKHAVSLQEEAFSFLRRWVDLTQTEESVADYVQQTAARIRSDLAQTGLLSQRDRTDVIAWVDAAMETIGRLEKRGGNTLTTAVGHGDFQPGNIFVDDDNHLWVIDWENLDRRQLLYDVLVFGLPSRQSSGLVQRLENLLSNRERWLQRPGFQKWPELRDCTPARLRLTAAVFLLEEMAFYLAESRNPVFTRMSAGWMAFRSERDRALSVVLQV